jgi:formate-nitrite transporter family protein
MSDTTIATAAEQEQAHALGEPSAPVTLLVYGDYECPHTKALHFEIRRLLPRVATLLRFVYRHFPLRAVHPHAQLAAEAAEAAGAQGKFWPVHEYLFRRQWALTEVDLLRYAAKLELDTVAFGRALAARTYAPRVERDLQSGLARGVHGTPTLFLDANRYDGARTADALERAAREVVDAW